ncbi:hypothetical protein EW026_g7680 [Hermanssonia centrifuga]|uniref:Cytochrome P450 n=1 Tax=Hermanssonia centrifuga TaxID=98765 RepID=A0A4S4K717_9APHY|nr:hypothetical protein EW026_g7680 [Hermanssonia centrifuga]
MTPIFYQTIHRLREAISCELNQTADCGQEIDFLNWMGRAALELIGQGGLGYSFDPLVANTENTFGDALKALMFVYPFHLSYRHFLAARAIAFCLTTPRKLGPPRLRRFLISLVPDVDIQELRQIVDIVADRSKEILDGKRKALEDGDEAVNMQVGEGKDIMSILLRQNMKIEDSEKLPEHELLAQMSTFVFAATDTTSNALARIFDLLAQHQHVQDKLRQEILESCDSEDGTFTDLSYDKLVELPYLDAVCRETLRLYPPVSFVTREAERDIVLPLSEPIQGVDGTPMKEILVPNGTTVIIGIRACNRNKAIWGEDALEWKPDRWLDSVPGSVKEARVPGIYANLMTFLGGGRACIGFKFSQLEMKVVLAVLLHSFKFLPSSKGIVWNFAGISYPTVSPVDKKPSMPMRIEPIFRNVVV